MSNKYYNAKDLDPNKLVDVKFPTYYKFKKFIKHSVLMILDKVDDDGLCHLHNVDYPSIHYEAKAEDLVAFEKVIKTYTLPLTEINLITCQVRRNREEDMNFDVNSRAGTIIVYEAYLEQVEDSTDVLAVKIEIGEINK